MSKQHKTFPDEQQETPVTKVSPEVDQPVDPRSPEIPMEDPNLVPEEVHVKNPPEEPGLPSPP